MGYADDITTSFIQKELAGIFSSSEGWNYQKKPFGGQNGSLLVFSRVYRGKHESCAVMATFEQKVGASLLDSFSLACPENPEWLKKILLVPRSAEVSEIPPGITVQVMKTFGFIDGHLTWLTRKKNSLACPGNILHAT